MGHGHELWRRLRHADYTIFEAFSALSLAFVWGVLLLWPTETFSSTPAYRAMVETWPHDERAWGLVGLGLGVVQSWAVARKWHVWRKWAALAASVAWTFIAVMFLIGAPTGVGWPTFGLHAVFSWLAHKSLLGEAWTGK